MSRFGWGERVIVDKKKKLTNKLLLFLIKPFDKTIIIRMVKYGRILLTLETRLSKHFPMVICNILIKVY
jgi:hypothetical protein